MTESIDFRGLRAKLSADAFALAEGPEPDPSDPVDEKTWTGITFLPDDVSLRTTEHHGTGLSHAYRAWAHWVGHVLDIQSITSNLTSDPLAVAVISAADEFQASIYAAMTGFYRQSIGTLRSVVESMLAAACFKKLADQEAELEQWLGGHAEGRFFVRRKRLQLARVAPFEAFERSSSPLLSDEGWLAWTYELLCAFVHGRPTHTAANGIVLETTNGGMWQSNGPIYVAQAFNFWESIYFNTMLLALLLSGLSDERLVRLEQPNDISFEQFVIRLMEWHPDPGACPTAAVVARYMFSH